MMPIQFRSSGALTKRNGFTLIELLVVISIMLLLLTITVFGVSLSQDADRVRGSASQIQSFLGGARDRAIYEDKAVGVRLFLDSSGDQTTVSSMAYIESPDSWDDGTIQLQRWDLDNDGQTDAPSATLDINEDGVLGDNPESVWVVAGVGTGWWELKRRGLLEDNLRIRIPKGSQGNWYPINTRLIDVTVAPGAVQKLILGIPYADPADTATANAQAFNAGGPEDYELELPAALRAEEPRLLADRTAVDLDGSKIPAAWGPNPVAAGGTGYSRRLDIMFSPRGNVVGNAASSGVIHLYVCDGGDSQTLKEYFAQPAITPPTYNYLIPADMVNLSPDPLMPDEDYDYPISDRRIVSIFTQTGAITINSVNPTDSNTDGIADDPFLFAEAGSEAN